MMGLLFVLPEVNFPCALFSLGFFQIEFYVFIVIITYTKREQIFFPTVLSLSFSQQHLFTLFLTLIKSNLPLFSFMAGTFSVFSEKA